MAERVMEGNISYEGKSHSEKQCCDVLLLYFSVRSSLTRALKTLSTAAVTSMSEKQLATRS